MGVEEGIEWRRRLRGKETPVKRWFLALLIVMTVGFLAAGCGSPEPFDVSGTTVGISTTADGPP